MTIRILSFGIARDILGGAETTIDVPDEATIASLRAQLYDAYPALTQLHSLAIARNNEYANDDEVITAQDEVVLIPPVSGG